jgi:hypothetical protein
VLVLLVITMAVAALRGLWSPCGLSMLSSLNPVSERARGHRFWVTACWYVVGAAAGGALLGTGCALGAGTLARAAVPACARWTLALLAALVTVASDSTMIGWTLPSHPRQVNEQWLTTYRRWIYAGGYGTQIGTGFATYIMSATMYLTAALAVLTANPTTAFAAGSCFGLLRGIGITVAAGTRRPQQLRSLLARIDAWAPASVYLAYAAEILVAATCADALAGPDPAAAVAAVLTALVTAVPLLARHQPVRRGDA